MSLTGSASPHIGLSPSFGSKLSLRGLLGEEGDEEEGGSSSRRLSPRSTKKKSAKHHKRIHSADPNAVNASEIETLDTILTYATEKTPLTKDGKNASSSSTDDSSASSGGEPPQLNFTLLITVLVVTIGSSLQFGYGTGVMNNSEQIIMEYFHDQGKEYDNVQWGTTVSCFGVGGLIGSVVGPKIIGKYCGRKTTLLINNIFLVISSALIIMAPQWYYQSIGRIFTGIVAGIVTAVVPTYFSEISPIEVRGAIGTCHQLGITIGILVSQALSTPSLNLLGSDELWKWLFIVPVLCGVAELLILPFCPESPSYLYLTKGEDAAKQSLCRLQSKDVANRYLGYIKEEIEESNDGGEGEMDTFKLLADTSLRKQLIVGVTVQLMMQFSGIDAVFYYSTRVFYQADVADPELATTCLGVINVIVTIFAVKWMDSAGRKTLLTYSWIGMCTSYIILTMSFIFKPYYDFMDQVSVISMTGVIIFFAFGPGCIAWFIIAEIFPLQARDTAMAIGIFINWVANWLVAFTFPILLEHTQPYTFLIFVATTGFFLFFTLKYVPETKGLTVKQVSKEFEKIKFPWDFTD